MAAVVSMPFPLVTCFSKIWPIPVSTPAPNNTSTQRSALACCPASNMLVPEPCHARCCTNSNNLVRPAAPNPVATPVRATASQNRPAPACQSVAGIVSSGGTFNGAALKVPPEETIPATLWQAGAGRFWLAVALTGAATGLGAAALTRLLEFVQHLAWHGSGTNILEAGQHASALRCVLVLFGAGVLTGIGQILLKQVTSGNGIDTTAAIWFYAGRMPALRTLGSAALTIFAVGMGSSMGREGAPKQAGAVFANFFSDWKRLSDEQRRLLVACGAGAGMGAAYGVPLGGALVAIEVMR